MQRNSVPENEHYYNHYRNKWTNIVHQHVRREVHHILLFRLFQATFIGFKNLFQQLSFFFKNPPQRLVDESNIFAEYRKTCLNTS